jgi:dihydroxy-acid dehydratase
MHGEALTVTGQSLEEICARSLTSTRHQEIISDLKHPLHSTGPLVVLRGNLAPDGAVAKVSDSR